MTDPAKPWTEPGPITVDPDRRSGAPCLRGTGFTVAQLLAELAETAAPDELADRFDLDARTIREVLNALAEKLPSARRDALAPWTRFADALLPADDPPPVS